MASVVSFFAEGGSLKINEGTPSVGRTAITARKAVRISGCEEWRIGAEGLIAASRGHFDEAEYQRQLKIGVGGCREPAAVEAQYRHRHPGEGQTQLTHQCV